MCVPQERLKKTNKLVKKAPKAVHHSHSTGELHGESEGNLHASGSGDGQLARADRTPPNFAALLKSFGSARRSSSAKTDGGPSSSGLHSGALQESLRDTELGLQQPSPYKQAVCSCACSSGI